jgi:quinol-cytochrome oxidoreductase complex cytochrome b subunit
MSIENSSEEKSWKLNDLDYPVPEHAEQFGYSIGGTVMVGFALLIITGIIMSFFYEPSVDGARISVLKLSAAPLGLWLRSFHKWTAETVTALIILHLSRVIFTGSYRGSRKLSWLLGVLLLFITVGFVFAGTVLKWDQEGYEAYQHAVETTELVPVIGGAMASVLKGSSAVMRMFALHTLVLPVLLGLFLVPHLALMKLNGLSPLPGQSSSLTSTFFRHLKRVLWFSMIIYGVVGFLAAQFPAALYPGPYSGVELTKPPWLFLVLYALEDWIGLYGLLVAPPVVLIGLVAIPYVDRAESLHSTVRKVIVWGYLAAVATTIFLIIYVGVSPPVRHLGMHMG